MPTILARRRQPGRRIRRRIHRARHGLEVGGLARRLQHDHARHMVVRVVEQHAVRGVDA
jgi:hypothetical protein